MLLTQRRLTLGSAAGKSGGEAGAFASPTAAACYATMPHNSLALFPSNSDLKLTN